MKEEGRRGRRRPDPGPGRGHVHRAPWARAATAARRATCAELPRDAGLVLGRPRMGPVPTRAGVPQLFKSKFVQPSPSVSLLLSAGGIGGPRLPWVRGVGAPVWPRGGLGVREFSIRSFLGPSSAQGFS